MNLNVLVVKKFMFREYKIRPNNYILEIQSFVSK